MENDKDQTVEKDDKTVRSTLKEEMREPSSLTGRPNIDVITARNEKEAKQDRRSLYKAGGIVAVFVLIIIIAVYFFS